MNERNRRINHGSLLLISVSCLLCLMALTPACEVFGYEAGESLSVSLDGGFAPAFGNVFTSACTDTGVLAETECWRPTKSSRYNASAVLQSYLKYAYNSAGRLIKTSRYSPSDSVNPESYVTYKYNTKGQLTKVSVYDGDALKYSGTSQYNANGRLTKGSAYDDNGTLIYYGTCSYNTKGRIVKVSAYKPDNSLQYVAKIQYNSSGRITKVSIYDDANVLQAYFTYNYDGKGRLSKDTLYVNFFGWWIKYYYTTYNYALGPCLGGSPDPLFFWSMLASFLEL